MTKIKELNVRSAIAMLGLTIGLTGCGLNEKATKDSEFYFTGFEDVTTEKYFNISDKKTGETVLFINKQDLNNALPDGKHYDLGFKVDENGNATVIPGSQLPGSNPDYISHSCQKDLDGHILIGTIDGYMNWSASDYSVDILDGYHFKINGNQYDVKKTDVVDAYNDGAKKGYVVNFTPGENGESDGIAFERSKRSNGVDDKQGQLETVKVITKK